MNTKLFSSIFSGWPKSISGLVMGSALLFAPIGITFADGAPVESMNPVVESRGVMQKIEDTAITFRVKNQISDRQSIAEKAEVNVTTVNGIVLLTGSVKSAEDKQWCEDTAKVHPKVQKVINELKVRKQRSIFDLARDKALQTSTKFRVVNELDGESSTVHVISYDRVIYLMGVVSQSVAERATETARNTQNVERVITIFQFKKDVSETG